MDYIAMARRIRALITGSSASLPDEEALSVPYAYDKWEPAREYRVGDRVRYGHVLYKCLQAHTAIDTWMPDVAPSLWARVLIPDPEVIPDWVQPDSTNPYMTGDKVRFEGHIYESIIDNNIWSPTGYPAGWKLID